MTEQQFSDLIRNLESSLASLQRCIEILSNVQPRKGRGKDIKPRKRASARNSNLYLEREEMYNLYREGWSIASLERKYGCGRTTIRKKLDNYENEIGFGNEQHLTKDEDETISRIAREVKYKMNNS